MDWTYLLWIIPVYLIVTILHEGAHCLVAALFGADITSFKFWPHSRDKDPLTPDLNFWQYGFWVGVFDSNKEYYYWGSMRWDTHGKFIGPKRAWISFAPSIVDVVALSALFFTGAYATGFFLILTAGFAIDLVQAWLQPLWTKRGDIRAAFRALS